MLGGTLCLALVQNALLTALICCLCGCMDTGAPVWKTCDLVTLRAGLCGPDNGGVIGWG